MKIYNVGVLPLMAYGSEIATYGHIVAINGNGWPLHGNSMARSCHKWASMATNLGLGVAGSHGQTTRTYSTSEQLSVLACSDSESEI